MNTRRVGVVAGWVVATLAAMTLASQAVGLVRDQVTDRPSQVPASLAAATTSTNLPATTVADSPTSTTGPSTTTSASSITTSTTSATTSTTSATVVDSTTSTTTPKATTTTVSPPPGGVQAVYLIGGTVTVRCSDGDVSWDSYVPNPGFSAEVEKPGPVELQIEFESRTHKSKLRAACDSGVLDLHTEEKQED